MYNYSSKNNEKRRNRNETQFRAPTKSNRRYGRTRDPLLEERERRNRIKMEQIRYLEGEENRLMRESDEYSDNEYENDENRSNTGLSSIYKSPGVDRKLKQRDRTIGNEENRIVKRESRRKLLSPSYYDNRISRRNLIRKIDENERRNKWKKEEEDYYDYYDYIDDESDIWRSETKRKSERRLRDDTRRSKRRIKDESYNYENISDFEDTFSDEIDDLDRYDNYMKKPKRSSKKRKNRERNYKRDDYY